MSDTDAPLDTPPTNFDHVIYESLDPPKEPEPEIRGDQTGLDEAAAELTQTRAERNEIVERTWGDPRDWSKHAPGNRSVSAEHASDMLKETREAEARLAQAEIDNAIAKEVDEYRGQTQPTEQPQIQPELQPQLEQAPPAETELDRLLAPLPPEQRPHFVAAFNQMVESTRHQAALEYQAAVQQAQSAAQQYQQGITQAGAAAIAGTLAAFPELAGLNDMAQLSGAIQMMQRSNPQRYAQLQAHVGQVQATINAAHQQAAQQQILAQQQEQQRQAQTAHQFQRYADYHDSRTLLNETPEMRTAIQNTLIADAEREGIDKQTLAQIWNSNPAARHSFFQNLIADGMKYRLAQRNVSRAAVRPVAQVQRPGVSEPASDRSEFAEVSRAFAGRDLSVKDATKLLLAKRARR